LTNKELDLLVKRIMEIYEIENQQDIPLGVKRNKGYISQIKSRNNIPDDFIELLELKYPKAFAGKDDTTNTIPQFLNMLDRQLKLLEDQHKTIDKHAETINKQQNTIHIYATKEAPDITEAPKNGSPPSKKMQKVKPEN